MKSFCLGALAQKNSNDVDEVRSGASPNRQSTEVVKAMCALQQHQYNPPY